MAPPQKCKKCPPPGAPAFMTTYGDMVTLLLTFFVMMFTTATVDGYQLKLILAAFQGLGALDGGNTLSVGKLAEMGNTVMTLPSLDAGRALDRAREKAVSLFKPEIQTKKVKITEDERGLVITLLEDAYFRPASAELDIEGTRETMTKVAELLKDDLVADRTFRIEGHTDSSPTDPYGPWKTNWELSAARAVNTLHRLVEYGADEDRFQVMGLADTVPYYVDDDTPEERAYNRRIEIIILTEGHLGRSK